MKIEKLTKSHIQKMSDPELHQLRNQFAQVYDKFWTEKSWPGCTKEQFISKYAHLVLEMDERDILHKADGIDVSLMRKSLSDVARGTALSPDEPMPMTEPTIEIQRSVRLIKADADSPERIVYGIVAEPDEEDTQGDHETAEEIEKAAYWFMEKAQKIRITTDENHDDDNFSANLLENYIARSEVIMFGEVIKKGSWVMAYRLDEDTWEKVENGELTGFSMAGTAIRIEDADNTG